MGAAGQGLATSRSPAPCPQPPPRAPLRARGRFARFCFPHLFARSAPGGSLSVWDGPAACALRGREAHHRLELEMASGSATHSPVLEGCTVDTNRHFYWIPNLELHLLWKIVFARRIFSSYVENTRESLGTRNVISQRRKKSCVFPVCDSVVAWGLLKGPESYPTRLHYGETRTIVCTANKIRKNFGTRKETWPWNPRVIFHVQHVL